MVCVMISNGQGNMALIEMTSLRQVDLLCLCYKYKNNVNKNEL